MKYTKGVIKIAYRYLFNSALHLCEGKRQNSKNVVQVYFTYNKPYYLHCYKPEKQTGLISIYITLIMNLFTIQLPIL